MKIKLANRKIAGEIDESTGVFTKRIKGSKHLLRTPPAIAIDARAFDMYILNYCYEMIVFDTETNKTYKTNTLVFQEKKKTINRSYGLQYMLPLQYWEVIK